MNSAKPLDHPTPDRPHRLYYALTNHCNRTCPWCSTCSSPQGSTYLSLDAYRASFPTDRDFQVQLEGGEPTLHPQFWDFVRIAREHPRCTHLVLCTNGTVLPRDRGRLEAYIDRLGKPLTLKLSVNHHLVDHDRGLIDLACLLRDGMDRERTLVVNVRLRRTAPNADAHITRLIEDAGLLPVSNIFYLQRYGFAANESQWDPPAPVWHEFTLLNPDGQTFGPDLIARSEAMRILP
jgi:MoaA/NifB/PqqE/SkfB family radical SAM enzyme